MADANPGWVRGAAAVVLFILLAGACATGFAAAALVKAPPFPPEWQLTSTKAQVSEAEQTPLVGLVAREPLNQGLFNLYFATEVRQGTEAAQRDAMANVLKELGWRDNSAQRNLIFEAVRTNDLPLALLRADGLLRRDKLTDTLLPIMRRLEMDAQASGLLIERLSRNPNWRDAYFGNVQNLEDPAARAFRQRLFERMFAAGHPVTRSELKPSLDAFVRWAEPERAAAVVAILGGTPTKGALNSDPDFAQAAKLMGDDRGLSLPTEWQAGAGSGVDADIADDGDGARMRIRWNGSGSPVLVQQMVARKGASTFRLAVVLADKASLQEFDRVGFRWACTRRSSAPFAVTERDTANLRITLSLADPPECGFGLLQVVGLPQASDQPVNIGFRSVTLLAGG